MTSIHSRLLSRVPELSSGTMICAFSWTKENKSRMIASDWARTSATCHRQRSTRGRRLAIGRTVRSDPSRPTCCWTTGLNTASATSRSSSVSKWTCLTTATAPTPTTEVANTAAPWVRTPARWRAPQKIWTRSRSLGLIDSELKRQWSCTPGTWSSVWHLRRISSFTTYLSHFFHAKTSKTKWPSESIQMRKKLRLKNSRKISNWLTKKLLKRLQRAIISLKAPCS